jgi:hypothetical protein
VNGGFSGLGLSKASRPISSFGKQKAIQTQAQYEGFWDAVGRKQCIWVKPKFKNTMGEKFG